MSKVFKKVLPALLKGLICSAVLVAAIALAEIVIFKWAELMTYLQFKLGFWVTASIFAFVLFIGTATLLTIIEYRKK